MTALKALATFNSVRLIWVPGHCGIAGNEKIRLLSRLPPLALLDLKHPLVSVYPPSAAILAHGLCVNRIDCGMSYLAKLFLHELDRSQAHFALNLPRKDLRILVGLLTGHMDLNRHLHIMELHQDSICPLCQEEEDTTAPFTAQCNALMLLWKNVLGDYILSSDTLSNIHWFLLLKFAKAVVCFGLFMQTSTPQVR